MTATNDPPTGPTSRWSTRPGQSTATRCAWDRCRGRAISGRHLASPTCRPRPVFTAWTPRTRNGRGATASSCPSANTPLALYAALIEAGISPEQEIATYGMDGSYLPMSSMASCTSGDHWRTAGSRAGDRHRHGDGPAAQDEPGLRHQPEAGRRTWRRLDLGGRDVGQRRDAWHSSSHLFSRRCPLFACYASRAWPELLTRREDRAAASACSHGDQDHLNAVFKNSMVQLDPAWNSSCGPIVAAVLRRWSVAELTQVAAA